jgi:hypothetical protein
MNGAQLDEQVRVEGAPAVIELDEVPFGVLRRTQPLIIEYPSWEGMRRQALLGCSTGKPNNGVLRFSSISLRSISELATPGYQWSH